MPHGFLSLMPLDSAYQTRHLGKKFFVDGLYKMRLSMDVRTDKNKNKR